VNTRFAFTRRETRLLSLMLDRASLGGEIYTAAQKLALSLRSRGIEAPTIVEALEEAPLSAKRLKPDYGLTVMPWGKHKGQPLCDIPPHYLSWVITHWARENPAGASAFTELLHAIRVFLHPSN
jgi:uncharacterized protein (DUF3820 family)